MGLLLLTDKGFDVSLPRNLCEQRWWQKVLGDWISYRRIIAKKYATIITLRVYRGIIIESLRKSSKSHSENQFFTS